MRVKVDNLGVWDHEMHSGDCGADGWQYGPSDFPDAGWGDVCYHEVSVVAPCAGGSMMSVRFEVDLSASDDLSHSPSPAFLALTSSMARRWRGCQSEVDLRAQCGSARR